MIPPMSDRHAAAIGQYRGWWDRRNFRPSRLQADLITYGGLVHLNHLYIFGYIIGWLWGFPKDAEMPGDWRGQ